MLILTKDKVKLTKISEKKIHNNLVISEYRVFEKKFQLFKNSTHFELKHFNPNFYKCKKKKCIFGFYIKFPSKNVNFNYDWVSNKKVVKQQINFEDIPHLLLQRSMWKWVVHWVKGDILETKPTYKDLET